MFGIKEGKQMSLRKAVELNNKEDKLEPINWNKQSDGMS